MRKAALLLFLIVLATPALAQMSAANPFVEKLVAYHTRIAAAFGCGSLANKNFDQQLALLEFLPANQNFQNWSRMFSANVLPLPDQQNQVLERMTAFRQNLIDTIGKQGKVLDVRDMKTSDGLPVMYIEYDATDGHNSENAIGVFARNSTQLASFMQIQARNARLSDVDRANMQQLAINMSKR